MKRRAASRLPKLVESPAHIEENTNNSKLSSTIGRRPNVFANGTHHKFEAPIMRMLTWRIVSSSQSTDKDEIVCLTASRWVNSENGFGGRPKIGEAAYIGSALDIDALVILTTNGTNDIHASIVILRHQGKLRGSAGSAEGWGTRRSSL